MSDPSGPPVTVEIRRGVRAGARPRFEADLQALIKDSLRFHEDGHPGVTVCAPDAGPGVEAEDRVVLKFARQSQWRTWQASEQLAQWLSTIREHLSAEPEVREVSGLEAWFTLPGEPVVLPPPRHKMFLVTWFAVFSSVTAVSLATRSFTGEWNPHLRTLFVTGLVVLLLTYLVMPNLVRLLRGWLHPKR